MKLFKNSERKKEKLSTNFNKKKNKKKNYLEGERSVETFFLFFFFPLEQTRWNLGELRISSLKSNYA